LVKRKRLRNLISSLVHPQGIANLSPLLPNPEGIANSSPGLRGRSYPGKIRGFNFGATPTRLWLHFISMPRVGNNPGLASEIPLGFSQDAIYATASASSAMLGGNWTLRFSTESLPEMGWG
jgi:hypothetical protein